jgi:hypothetical protein
MQGRSLVLQVDHTPLVPTGVLVCLGLHESVTFLADLRPVHAITAWLLTDLAASDRHACTLAFSRPSRVKQYQSSSVPKRKLSATGSCLLYPG